MKVDFHVHVVGTGAGGTGCWMRSGGWRKPMENWMCRHIGLPLSAFKGDFDRLYADRLVQLVRDSSLDAAVILAQEAVYNERGEKLHCGSFYVPNDYVLQLARRHPEFIPAVSIHPARKDALDELDRCISERAALLKILPNCHNIDCSLPRYRKFWERMAEARLPLLAHTGGEHTLPVVDARLADPRTLKLPLECGVTVIAAHCATKSGLFDPDYLNVLIEMMACYPRLYADNSAFNIPVRSRAFRTSLQAPLVDRLVHGSDFPVLVFGHWAWMRGLIDRATLARWQSNPNVLERDCQIKRAIGYPDAVFTRGGGLLRLNRKTAASVS
jgi:predicted TIM-barrel fold metal-dependent hydrolase